MRSRCAILDLASVPEGGRVTKGRMKKAKLRGRVPALLGGGTSQYGRHRQRGDGGGDRKDQLRRQKEKLGKVFFGSLQDRYENGDEFVAFLPERR
jgi:hypothetical protein